MAAFTGIGLEGLSDVGVSPERRGVRPMDAGVIPPSFGLTAIPFCSS